MLKEVIKGKWSKNRGGDHYSGGHEKFMPCFVVIKLAHEEGMFTMFLRIKLGVFI